jgi:hypothetical protein
MATIFTLARWAPVRHRLFSWIPRRWFFANGYASFPSSQPFRKALYKFPASQPQIQKASSIGISGIMYKNLQGFPSCRGLVMAEPPS